MMFLRDGLSCLATTEGEGLAGESRPEMLLKYFMRQIFPIFSLQPGWRSGELWRCLRCSEDQRR